MNTLTHTEILDKYSDTHLICDSSYPLITNSTLEEEAMLYNLSKKEISEVIDIYGKTSGTILHFTSDISALSGGQKIILMVILALYSNASHIVFVNLCSGLDNERADAIRALVNKYTQSKTDILLV